MRGILFLAVLSVKSSYSRDIELSVEGPNDVPDTLQWWFGARGQLLHQRPWRESRKLPMSSKPSILRPLLTTEAPGVR